jgi:hypothetical protein
VSAYLRRPAWREARRRLLRFFRKELDWRAIAKQLGGRGGNPLSGRPRMFQNSAKGFGNAGEGCQRLSIQWQSAWNASVIKSHSNLTQLHEQNFRGRFLERGRRASRFLKGGFRPNHGCSRCFPSCRRLATGLLGREDAKTWEFVRGIPAAQLDFQVTAV